MSKRYEDLIKNARMNADCGEHMSPAEVTTLLNVVETTLSALAAENAGMNAFVDALLSIAWQGGSADGAEIQKLAFKHGLLRQEVYSADEHENQVDDPGNFEDGDPVYFRVDKTASDAFLAEVRAGAVDEVCLKISNSIPNCYQDELVGLDMAATICGDFASEIRKGAQS